MILTIFLQAYVVPSYFESGNVADWNRGADWYPCVQHGHCVEELAVRMKENTPASHSLKNQDHSGPWYILTKYIYCFKQPCLFLHICIPTCKFFSKEIYFTSRGGEKKVKTKSRRVFKINYFSPVNFPKSLTIRESQETCPLVHWATHFYRYKMRTMKIVNKTFENFFIRSTLATGMNNKVWKNIHIHLQIHCASSFTNSPDWCTAQVTFKWKKDTELFVLANSITAFLHWETFFKI